MHFPTFSVFFPLFLSIFFSPLHISGLPRWIHDLEDVMEKTNRGEMKGERKRRSGSGKRQRSERRSRKRRSGRRRRKRRSGGDKKKKKSGRGTETARRREMARGKGAEGEA
jgi:hypothetical protein